MVKHGNSVILIAAIALVCVISACQTTQPANDQAITNLSNDLEETNQKIEEVYHRVSVLQFMIDNHERTIADLEKALKNSGVIQEGAPAQAAPSLSGVSPAKESEDKKITEKILTTSAEEKKPAAKTSEEGKSPEYIYNQGFAALKKKNYTKAISMFKTLVSKHPQHSLADNAIYWTGEIHYTQHDFPEAIKTFQRILVEYPEGGKAPDALLKIGYSYYSMNDNDNAVKYLKQVVVDYPFTVSGSKAEAMLKRIE